jgi:hypothetical protein
MYNMKLYIKNIKKFYVKRTKLKILTIFLKRKKNIFITIIDN